MTLRQLHRRPKTNTRQNTPVPGHKTKVSFSQQHFSELSLVSLLRVDRLRFHTPLLRSLVCFFFQALRHGVSIFQRYPRRASALEVFFIVFFQHDTQPQHQHQLFTFAFPLIFPIHEPRLHDTPPTTENQETGGMALHPFCVSGTKRSLPP
jgi:hypothetical protein